MAASLDGTSLASLAAVIVQAPDLQHPGSAVAAAYFVSHFAAPDPDHRDAVVPDWDRELARWLALLGDDRNDAFLIVSSAITWALRKDCRQTLTSLTLPRVIAVSESEPALYRVELALLLQAARYDFDFELIERVLNAAGRQITESSPYFRAMLQFSRLGRGKDVEREEIDAILTDAPESEKVLSLLAHGLWFTAGAAEADQLLELCGMLHQLNPSDHVTYMRKASAHRRRGEYDKAIIAINRAITLLPPGETEVHADYKLERVTIAIQHEATNRLTAAAQASIREASTALERRMSELIEETDRQLSDSLFKVVEILGVFTAIIGLIATVIAGQAIGSGLTWWMRLVVILAGGLVTISFFALLRWIVRPRSPASPSS